MEILQPVEIQSDTTEQTVEQPKIESTINLNQIQILSSLGLKDQIFNDEVMDKVKYISENIDLSEFEELFIKVGNDDFIPKLDKILTVIKLRSMGKDLDRRKQLINEQLKQYGE